MHSPNSISIMQYCAILLQAVQRRVAHSNGLAIVMLRVAPCAISLLQAPRHDLQCRIITTGIILIVFYNTTVLLIVCNMVFW